MLSSYLPEMSWNFPFSTEKLVEFKKKHSFHNFFKKSKRQKNQIKQLYPCVFFFLLSLDSCAVVQVVCCFIMTFHYAWIFKKLQKIKSIFGINKKEKEKKICFLKEKRKKHL